ncbi:MAG: hypothetical protein RMJ53_05655 [Chitinophagales bacterium]|nr:hypothetical protein [Chitinophagales bacterium]
MKTLFLKLFIVACLPFALISQTLTKEQKKQLKRELKSFRKNLEAYQQQKESAQKESEEKSAEIKKLKDEIAVKEGEKAELQQRLSIANKLLNECENRPPVTVDPSEIPMGTVYKVQIGFYKKYDITANFQKPKFIGYEDVEGYKRYVISSFETEEEAERLKNDLRALGVKDAFVAKYVDRQRIFEWEKNPKYKGKKAPASWRDVVK